MTTATDLIGKIYGDEVTDEDIEKIHGSKNFMVLGAGMACIANFDSSRLKLFIDANNKITAYAYN